MKKRTYSLNKDERLNQALNSEKVQLDSNGVPLTAKTHTGVEFRDRELHLDNNKFHDCSFTGCKIIYSGGWLEIGEGCRFSHCTFTFEGAAWRTFHFAALLAGRNPQLIMNMLMRSIDVPDGEDRVFRAGL